MGSITKIEEQGVTERNEKGQFVKGTSGNPVGRLKGTKNWLTLERLAFEKVLREYISDDTQAQKLLKGIDRVLDIAGDAASKDSDSLSAMKILLDRVMPVMPPKLEEEAEKTDRRLTIIIQTNPNAKVPIEAIEGEFTEVTTNGKLETDD